MSVGSTSIQQKLFTREDTWNIHKIIGAACLLSYAWRMSMVFSNNNNNNDDDMGFRSMPEHTPWTVVLHASLHVTSFQFQIPSRRIKQGTRIWPEYRLHSFCFAMRNLLLITLFWVEQVWDWKPLYWASTAIVFANMVAADVCTATSSSMPKQDAASSGGGTIRNIQTPRHVKYLFSSQQFMATSTFLFGPRVYSIQFMSALIIQVTPFVMTLYRKNLVSHVVVVVVYGCLLVIPFVLGAIPFVQMESLASIAIMAEVGKWAFLWRTNPWMPARWRNKYLIWATMTWLIHHAHVRSWTRQTVLYPWQIYVMALSTILVVWNGHVKCTAKSYAD